jgi:hypothetical protein
MFPKQVSHCSTRNPQLITTFIDQGRQCSQLKRDESFELRSVNPRHNRKVHHLQSATNQFLSSIKERNANPQSCPTLRISAQEWPPRLFTLHHCCWLSFHVSPGTFKTTSQLTDVNTLNPKIPRIDPNTLSKSPQRWPAASQHFLRDLFVTTPYCRRTLQGFTLLNTEVRLLPFTTGSDDTFSQHALFL